jgi:L-threonylcarbamoyladenylate synthase
VTPNGATTPATGPQTAVRDAAQRLAEGGLVAFPTETVYGLGARADNDAAVAAIFAAKGRPADHPLIVHVADAAQAARFARSIPPVAQRLIAAFWPGPLTLIVPRADGMARAAAGGHPTLGLRCPAHPLAQALLAAARELGVPGVAAPSANRFGRISPTTAQHVRDDFGAGLCIVDGGPCELGIESAIVDCSTDHPMLLRPGALTRAQIEAAAGEPLQTPDTHAAPAPGTLRAHYAPRAPLRLMGTAELRHALQPPSAANDAVALYSRTAPAALGLPDSTSLRWRPMPQDAAAAAHELFAALRELDGPATTRIWVEAPPESPEWEGVRDRLQRAAAAF